MLKWETTITPIIAECSPLLFCSSEKAQLSLNAWEEEDLLTEQQQQQEWNSCEVPVKHFLSVAADRIVEAVEKMMSGYKGELDQSKREIIRQHKMLSALLRPDIRLTRLTWNSIPGNDTSMFKCI